MSTAPRSASALLVRAVVSAFVGLGIVVGGCHDQYGLQCTTNSNGCECGAMDESKQTSPTIDTCDETYLGGSICCAHPGYAGADFSSDSGASCACSTWSCAPNASEPGGCTCETDDTVGSTTTDCSAPPGGICCATEGFCSCDPDRTTCNGGFTAVESCNLGTANLASSLCGSTMDPVSSCSQTASSGGTDTGGGSSCTPGPGLCKNGDSSTCSCATSCQHVCETCDYACLRNCSTDAECEGLTDSAGTPLTCSSCPQGVCNAGFSACD